MDENLAERIRALVDSDADRAGGDDLRAAHLIVRRRRGQRRAVGLAAAVVLVVLTGVGAVLVVGSDDDGPETVAVGLATSPPGDPEATTSSTGGQPRQQPAVPGQWRAVSPPPIEPRVDAAIAASDREVFVWGGRDEVSGEVMNDVAILDVASGQWETHEGPAGSTGRSGASAIWNGSAFLVIGGWAPGSPGASATTVLSYNPELDSWATVADDQRAARTNPVIGLHDGEILIVGGYTGVTGDPTSTASALDPTSGAWRDMEAAPWPIVDGNARPGSGARGAAASPDGVISVDLSVVAGEASLTRARLGAQGWTVGEPVGIGSTDVAGDPPRVTPASNEGPSLVITHLDQVVATVLSAGDEVDAQSSLTGTSCGEGGGHAAVAVDSGWVVYDCESWQRLDSALSGTALPLPPVSVPTVVRAGSTLVALDLGSPPDNPNTSPRGGAAATLGF